MKGTLCKTHRGWEVHCLDERNETKYYPLHPKHVREIQRDALVFDNIEARINAYPNVEFFPVIDADIDLVREWACLIERDETIQVSRKDLEVILNNIENPPTPNDELKKVFEKYKNKLG